MSDNGETTDKEAKPRPVSPINGQPVPMGRQKGIPNKATTKFKEALNQLLETSAPQMIGWLEQIDQPEKRFDILSKFVEYIHPKLARSEVQPLDKHGDPTDLADQASKMTAQDAYKALIDNGKL